MPPPAIHVVKDTGDYSSAPGSDDAVHNSRNLAPCLAPHRAIDKAAVAGVNNRALIHQLAHLLPRGSKPALGGLVP
jgi:hypothetical protein